MQALQRSIFAAAFAVASLPIATLAQQEVVKTPEQIRNEALWSAGDHLFWGGVAGGAGLFGLWAIPEATVTSGGTGAVYVLGTSTVGMAVSVDEVIVGGVQTIMIAAGDSKGAVSFGKDADQGIKTVTNSLSVLGAGALAWNLNKGGKAMDSVNAAGSLEHLGVALVDSKELLSNTFEKSAKALSGLNLGTRALANAKDIWDQIKALGEQWEKDHPQKPADKTPPTPAVIDKTNALPSGTNDHGTGIHNTFNGSSLGNGDGNGNANPNGATTTAPLKNQGEQDDGITFDKDGTVTLGIDPKFDKKPDSSTVDTTSRGTSGTTTGGATTGGTTAGDSSGGAGCIDKFDFDYNSNSKEEDYRIPVRPRPPVIIKVEMSPFC